MFFSSDWKASRSVPSGICLVPLKSKSACSFWALNMRSASCCTSGRLGGADDLSPYPAGALVPRRLCMGERSICPTEMNFSPSLARATSPAFRASNLWDTDSMDVDSVSKVILLFVGSIFLCLPSYESGRQGSEVAVASGRSKGGQAYCVPPGRRANKAPDPGVVAPRPDLEAR